MMAWRPRSPFLRASPARALLETLLVLAGAFLLCSLLFGAGSSGSARLFVFVPLCAILWCAVRLRLPTGAWRRRVAHDGVVGLLVGLALLPALTYAGALAYARRGIAGDVIAAIITETACASIFLLARVGGRLWLFWDRLRRTRLRWVLTHAHLVVVAAGLVLFDVLLTIINVWLGRGFPLFVIAATIAVTTIMMSIVLLPAALVSFVVARGVTRRIESLAAATSRLRGGDYDSRVAVTGEDEIAHLQIDFNAMATDLDRARRDLRAERDTVATLLRARQDLIASVSHELRTPVVTLRGYIESTRAHWDGGPPPTLREDVEVMEREAIRLQALIDDLFTLARADVARLEVRCAPADVGALARRSVDAVAPLAWQSGKVEVVARVAPDLPPALADAGRLEQVLRQSVTERRAPHAAWRHRGRGRRGGRGDGRGARARHRRGHRPRRPPAYMGAFLPSGTVPLTRDRRHGAGSRARQRVDRGDGRHGLGRERPWTRNVFHHTPATIRYRRP